jgi:hypothetical protein
MGKEALTCGPGASAGERKRGEWEMGRRWKAGSDRWEAEAGAADGKRLMWTSWIGEAEAVREEERVRFRGAADGSRARPMGTNWGIGRRGRKRKGL